ncbi:unnamed protein product [Strongylus vulgaris]|uniref:Uncharacterized protein n=1 Tax=Strongylus vulgaris TaxID=40348 RepID=A0A3P7IZF6_STRVU|nr:unnamed protein product [Strongylus vulgaris]
MLNEHVAQHLTTMSVAEPVSTNTSHSFRRPSRNPERKSWCQEEKKPYSKQHCIDIEWDRLSDWEVTGRETKKAGANATEADRKISDNDID